MMGDCSDLEADAPQLLAHEAMCTVPQQCRNKDDGPTVVQNPGAQAWGQGADPPLVLSDGVHPSPRNTGKTELTYSEVLLPR